MVRLQPVYVVYPLGSGIRPNGANSMAEYPEQEGGQAPIPQLDAIKKKKKKAVLNHKEQLL